jgi:hypothetical protein
MHCRARSRQLARAERHLLSKGNDQQSERNMRILGIVVFVVMIAIVVVIWRIKRPPPPPPVS